MPDQINTLRRVILADYAESLGLPKKAHYYGGARLRPVVPLDAAVVNTPRFRALSPRTVFSKATSIPMQQYGGLWRSRGPTVSRPTTLRPASEQ